MGAGLRAGLVHQMAGLVDTALADAALAAGDPSAPRRRKGLGKLEAHLTVPDLTAETSAASPGLSRRWLHALLDGAGTSFEADLTRRRLETCGWRPAAGDLPGPSGGPDTDAPDDHGDRPCQRLRRSRNLLSPVPPARSDETRGRTRRSPRPPTTTAPGPQPEPAGSPHDATQATCRDAPRCAHSHGCSTVAAVDRCRRHGSGARREGRNARGGAGLDAGDEGAAPRPHGRVAVGKQIDHLSTITC